MTISAQGILEKLPSYGQAYLDWNNGHMSREYTKFSKAYVSAEPDGSTLSKLDVLKSYYPELKI